MEPPCSSHTQLAIASPRSVPPPESPQDPKRSKTRAARSAGIPGPSSATSSIHRSESRTPALTVTEPPTGLWRTALSRRLAAPGQGGRRPPRRAGRHRARPRLQCLAARPTGLVDHGDEADPPLVGATGRGSRLLRDEPLHVDGRERQRLDAAVDPAEVEEVGNEIAQALGLGEGGAERGVVRRHDAVDEVLEQRLLGGEGRAQLVGHGGDELTALLVRRREVGRHGVEGARQLAHLVGRGGRDPA